MKRVAGALLLLLGLVGLLGSVAGIVGSWIGYQRTSAALERAAVRVDGLFDRSTHLLDTVQSALVKARTELDAHEEAEKAAVTAPSKDSFLRRQTARKATQDIAPELRDSRRTLSQVTDVAIVVNSLLEGEKELDIGAAPLDPAQVDEVSARLTTLIEKAESLQVRLARVEPDAAEPDDLKAEASQAREAVTRLIELVNQARERVLTGKQKVADLHTRTQFWLFWGTVALTVLLVWIGLGQWCLMVQGWRWLFGPRASPIPEPSVEQM